MLFFRDGSYFMKRGQYNLTTVRKCLHSVASRYSTDL